MIDENKILNVTARRGRRNPFYELENACFR